MSNFKIQGSPAPLPTPICAVLNDKLKIYFAVLQLCKKAAIFKPRWYR